MVQRLIQWLSALNNNQEFWRSRRVSPGGVR